MLKIIKIIKRKKLLWGSIGVMVLIIILVFVFGGDGNYETETVLKGDVIETVTATGQVQAKNTAKVSFPVSGTIEKLLLDIGDTVEEGQIIAQLRGQDIQRNVNEAQANLGAARVVLNSKYQDQLDQISENKQALDILYESALGVFSNLYGLAQQAHYIFEGFIDGSSLAPSIDRGISSDTKIDAVDDTVWPNRKGFRKLTDLLANFSPSATRLEIDLTLEQIRPELLKIRTAFTALHTALTDADKSVLGASVLSGYRNDVNDGLDKINDALDKEFDLSNGIANQEATNQFSLNDAKASYNSQLATVETKNATLSKVYGNLRDAKLRAPISGTIARRGPEIGERVAVGEEIYYIIQGSDLEVAVNIPEVDIGDLSSAIRVETTLDALGSDEVFDLELIRIDPDQTNIDGVVYYQSIFEFKLFNERFRPGMTANLTVVVSERINVLTVARRAIRSRNGNAEVEVLTGRGKEKREIQLGLRGDFNIEVISGVSEGEELIIGKAK